MNQQKCILIHSPKLFYNGKNICSSINYSAMGLFSLASELEKSGFETEIIHLGIEKYLNKNFSISNYIKENEIKFAAFSLNWQQQSYDVIETARQIKKTINRCRGIPFLIDAREEQRILIPRRSDLINSTE